MTTLPSLIERLEAAKGPDRELEYDIDRLLFRRTPREIWTPHYTSKIDEAMSLVPVEWRVDVQRTKPSRDSGYACVWGPAGNRSARAVAPAIALCIAILKARMDKVGE